MNSETDFMLKHRTKCVLYQMTQVNKDTGKQGMNQHKQRQELSIKPVQQLGMSRKRNKPLVY